MLAAGALGTLLGGRMSDLHGFRKVVVYSLFASAPLALLVPVVPLLALFPLLALLGLDLGDELLSRSSSSHSGRCRGTWASRRA